MRETSILVFIPLAPARRCVGRSSNVTIVNRGMPQTLMKWQLPQLWYCRRAIVAGDQGLPAAASWAVFIQQGPTLSRASVCRGAEGAASLYDPAVRREAQDRE
jgi:hypothetical protein